MARWIWCRAAVRDYDELDMARVEFCAQKGTDVEKFWGHDIRPFCVQDEELAEELTWYAPTLLTEGTHVSTFDHGLQRPHISGR